MKKSVNLIFSVHQPYRLRRYRFFDIGNDNYYLDDYANQSDIEWLARNCYLPAASMLLRMLTRHKDAFTVSLYLSGTALELFSRYAPQVLESFRRLAEAGQVELLGGTWAHSPAAMHQIEAFSDQVKLHQGLVRDLFGYTPQTFYSPELLYSDTMGEWIHSLGFRATIADGGRHVLGWRSPDMIYSNATHPDFKIHLRNQPFCDSLYSQFSGENLQATGYSPSTFIDALEQGTPGEQEVNLCFDMEWLGARSPSEPGIFSFMESFIDGVAHSNTLYFTTPEETNRLYPPAAVLSVPYPMSWAAPERDMAALTGNDLQQEAMRQLFALSEELRGTTANAIYQDWIKLQSTDHFYMMSDSYYARGLTNRPNPFHTPHEAFINYMNIISDLKLRLSS